MSGRGIGNFLSDRSVKLDDLLLQPGYFHPFSIQYPGSSSNFRVFRVFAQHFRLPPQKMVWDRLYEPCEHWLRGASGSSQPQSEVAETGALRSPVFWGVRGLEMGCVECPVKQLLRWGWVKANYYYTWGNSHPASSSYTSYFWDFVWIPATFDWF